MALDTIPKQEGGKLKAVASGTLPSGQPVVVNSDGTVSAAGVNTVSTSLGSAVNFTTADIGSQGAVYDPVQNKVVVIYKDGDNNNYGTAVVGSVNPSDNSMTFGTPVVFESGSVNISLSNPVTYDVASGKIVVVYEDSDNGGGAGTAIVGTVSGTSISFGTAAVYAAVDLQGALENSVAYSTEAQKVLICYRDNPAGDLGKALVGTVSGTSISFGSTVTYNAASTPGTSLAYSPVSDSFLLAYTDQGNSGYGTAIVATISGTSVSFGSETVFNSGGFTGFTNCVYDPSTTKFIIAYKDNSDTLGKALVATVSGTSVSFGPTSSSGVDGSQLVMGFDENVNKPVLLFRDGSNSLEASYIIGEVSGDSITFGTKAELNANGRSDYFGVAYDSGSKRLVISARKIPATFGGTGYVLTVGGDVPNLTAENYIGMSGGVVTINDDLLGTPSVFEAADTAWASAVYDTNAQKVVLAYRDSGNSGYGTAIVGTVSGDAISFGSPAVFASSSLGWVSATYDVNAQKVVVAYKDFGNSNHGKAVVGTVSGTSISFGSIATFEAASVDSLGITFDSTNNKVVIAYQDGGNSSYGTAVVGTVSGTSISFGTPVVFESAVSSRFSAVYDTNSQKVVVSYRDDGNTGDGTAIVGTVSGTSISFGTAVVFETDSTELVTSTYNSGAQKVIVAYRNADNSDYGTAIVGTVSGTSISFGSASVFHSAAIGSGFTGNIAATYDANQDKIVITFSDNSAIGTAVSGTVSGTSISFESPFAFEDTVVDYNSAVYEPNAQIVVAAYQNQGNSNHGTAIALKPPYSEITRSEVADGDAATVDIVGTVSTNQVSLTPGQQYYVQTDGTIGTTPADPSVLAGTAVSATKMVVKS